MPRATRKRTAEGLEGERLRQRANVRATAIMEARMAERQSHVAIIHTLDGDPMYCCDLCGETRKNVEMLYPDGSFSHMVFEDCPSCFTCPNCAYVGILKRVLQKTNPFWPLCPRCKHHCPDMQQGKEIQILRSGSSAYFSTIQILGEATITRNFPARE